MPMTVDQLVAEALNLPTEARVELAERLALSMDAGELTEIDKRWAAEARRRADELISGKVQGIPGEQVFAEARRILGE
jgi:putative addiction module component (TIGR02574 family)